MTSATLAVGNCRWIAVPGASDVRGSVNFLELGKGLDFVPKRLSWLRNVAPGQRRGRYGHRQTQLIFIAMQGSCRLHLDDVKARQTLLLDDPTRAVHVGPWVWLELTDFAPGAAIAMLASTPYEEAEYLRDYDMFKRAMGKREMGERAR